MEENHDNHTSHVTKDGVVHTVVEPDRIFAVYPLDRYYRMMQGEAYTPDGEIEAQQVMANGQAIMLPA